MDNVIVIHEEDLGDNEKSVIGVASSIEKAEELIQEYYGTIETVSCEHINCCSLIYRKILNVLDHSDKPYKVEIWLEWFGVNQA